MSQSKNKFLLFFLVLFQTAFTLSAQTDPKLPARKRFIDKVEIYGALTLNFPDDHGWSDFIYEGSEGRTIDKLHAERGYFFGCGLIHSFGKRFELQGKFSQERKVYSRSIVSLDFNGNISGEIQSEYKNDYLTFSLVPTYFLSNSNRLHLFSGLTYAYVTRSMEYSKYFTNGQYVGGATANILDGQKNVIEALVGVGYLFPMGKRFSCAFRIQGNYGLSYTSSQNKQQTSLNAASLSVTIGYLRK